MKIICLNTYLGTAFEALMVFVGQAAQDTDVFCFQEILLAKQPGLINTKRGKRANLLEELTKLLVGFDVFFAPSQDGFDASVDLEAGIQLGIAMFVKKGLSVTASGDFFIYRSFNSYIPPDFSTLPSNAQFVELGLNGTPLTICNVHAASQPAHKLDSPDRLIQSQKILDFLKDRPGEKLVMGDFNLLPDTDSIRMFTAAGYRNLIAEHHITTTRGSMNRLLHPEFASGKYGYQEFADYAFISPALTVTRFEVPDVPVSDHLPMILEIDV